MGSVDPTLEHGHLSSLVRDFTRRVQRHTLRFPSAHVRSCPTSSLLFLEPRSAETYVDSDQSFWDKCCRDGQEASLEYGRLLQWWPQRWGRLRTYRRMRRSLATVRKLENHSGGSEIISFLLAPGIETLKRNLNVITSSVETEQIELRDLLSPPSKWALFRRMWPWDVEHVGEWTWAGGGFLILYSSLRPSCQRRCPLKWEIPASPPRGLCLPRLVSGHGEACSLLFSKPSKHASHLPVSFCLRALRGPAHLTQETTQMLKGRCAFGNHVQEMLELQWD